MSKRLSVGWAEQYPVIATLAHSRANVSLMDRKLWPQVPAARRIGRREPFESTAHRQACIVRAFATVFS